MDEMDEILLIDEIPCYSYCKILTLCNDSYRPCKYIPEKILSLYIVTDDNQNYFDEAIDFIVKNEIESVYITGYINNSDNTYNFINKLPSCVKYISSRIKGNVKNNVSFDNLPIDLLYLDLGFSYNISLDMLPLNLKYLSLGYCYNKPLDNLPNGLEILIIEGIYNHTLDNLPDSITYLGLDLKNFDLPITKLPNSLVHLNITIPYNNDFTNKIIYIFQNTMYPDTLERFNFDYYHCYINLQSLEGYIFNIAQINFPKKLKELGFGYPVNTILNKLTIPENTETIHLNAYFFILCYFI
jgi:hypothetical protein